MSKIYDVLSNSIQHVEVPFNYKRGNPLPLDNSTIWQALDIAKLYAADSLDTLKTLSAEYSMTSAQAETAITFNNTSYDGQVIVAPNEAGELTQYMVKNGVLEPIGTQKWETLAALEAAAISSDTITVGTMAIAPNEKGDLALFMVVADGETKAIKPVGTEVVADNKTLSVDPDGIIGLLGTEELLSTNIYTPKFVGGKLEWVDSTETPDAYDLSALVGDHEERIAQIETVEIPRLDKRIDDEISARKAADEEISAVISAHIVSCEAADEFLSAAIDTEVSVRQEADEFLSAAIDTEVSVRQEADTILQANIDKVAEDLAAHTLTCEQADKDLSDAIDTETSARIDADVILQANIDKVAEDLAAHTLTCEQADKDLSDALADEISVRAEADKFLSGQISTLSGEVGEISSGFDQRLTSLEDLTKTHTEQIDEISGTVVSLAGKAFKFVGTYDDLSAVELSNIVTGNVVIVGNKEYVYVDDHFELLGDTGDFATSETVQGWISTAKEEVISYTDAEISTVNQIATDAKTIAGTAEGKADQAVTTAGEAKDTADAALSVATSAFEGISQAETAAKAAQDAAEAADSKATKAAQDATEAGKDAAAAAQQAVIAETNAIQAAQSAEAAVTSATTAVETANTASGKADQAVTTAGEAKTTAEAAVETANTASGKADQAVATATDAKAIAEVAEANAIAHANELCAELSESIKTVIGDVEGNVGEAIEKAIKEEADNRISAIGELAQVISDLTEATEAAITSLSQELTAADAAIASSLELSVETLTAQIDNSVTTLTAADAAITSSLELSVETLTAQIDTVKTDLLSTLDANAQTIADEYAAADTALSTALVGEFTAADTVLEGKITQAFADADEELSGKLVEVFTTADETLSSKLVNEFKDADEDLSIALTSIIDKVSADLTSHVVTCEQADSDLCAAISGISSQLPGFQKKLSATSGLSIQTAGNIDNIGIDFSQLASGTISVDGVTLGVNIDAVVGGLSTALSNDITSLSGELTAVDSGLQKAIDDEISVRAKDDEFLSGQISALSVEVSSISADHETRIGTIEDTVKGLTNATRFIGIAAEGAVISGTTNTEIELENGTHEIQSGDIVIVGNAEYIAVIAAYRNDEAKTPEFKWVQLGDESTCAKTLDLIQEHIITCELADVTLSNMVSTVSADLIELSTKFEDHVVSCEQADADLSAALSAEISARQEADEFLSGVIADEISARISSDAELDDKISAIDDRITDIEATLSGILILNGGNAFGW